MGDLSITFATGGDSRIRTCIAWRFKPPLYRWSYIPEWFLEPENGIEPLSTDYKSAALPLCYPDRRGPGRIRTFDPRLNKPSLRR